MTAFTTSTESSHVWDAYCHALAEALRVAKSQEADTGKYKYNYAKLDDVLAAIGNALDEKGAVLTQIPSGTPDGLVWQLTTMILHVASGEWIEFAPYTRPQAVVRDEQGFGGALTYARRYSLIAIFRIATADDDAQDVTQQQRNIQKYDGLRTREELAIRAVMATYPAHPLFRESFMERFGRALSDLPERQHPDALRFALEFFADPPPIGQQDETPPEIPSADDEGEPASPQAGGAAPGQDSAPDPAPAPRKKAAKDG